MIYLCQARGLLTANCVLDSVAERQTKDQDASAIRVLMMQSVSRVLRAFNVSLLQFLITMIICICPLYTATSTEVQNTAKRHATTVAPAAFLSQSLSVVVLQSTGWNFLQNNLNGTLLGSWGSQTQATFHLCNGNMYA